MEKKVNGNEITVFIILFLTRHVNPSLNASLYNDGQVPKSHSWVPWSLFTTAPLHGAYPDALRQGWPQIERPQGPGHTVLPPGFEQFLKNRSSHKDAYLHPYWPQGHWAFDRDAATRKPVYKIDPTNPPHRNCNQPCPVIYESYGTVCGQSYSSQLGLYIYKNFVNICELEYENCKIKSKRGSGNHDPRLSSHCIITAPTDQSLESMQNQPYNL